jgi:hypothetical protein
MVSGTGRSGSHTVLPGHQFKGSMASSFLPKHSDSVQELELLWSRTSNFTLYGNDAGPPLEQASHGEHRIFGF